MLEQGRRTEIQLRTPAQNRWADAVEATADRLGLPLKIGRGPSDLLRYFERAAVKLAAEEEGRTVDDDFKRDFEALREEVRHYFSGPS